MNATKIEKISAFISTCKEKYGKTEFTMKELRQMPSAGIKVPAPIWDCGIEGTRPKMFSLDILERNFIGGEKVSSFEPEVTEPETKLELQVIESAPEKLQDTEMNQEMSSDIDDLRGYDIYIPEVNPNYVPYGKNYKLIKNIIESGEFFPVYIYGISGVGKTSSIEHICATLRKPFFRVQITAETIDEDLIGSMKLVDGNTVWQDGPVVSAYRCGGVVVLDECDLNANLMILQPILERKPFYIKQTGELVKPSEGFTIFATGNTKGDGTDCRYIGTTVLNDAFLERFGAIIEQGFVPIKTEKKIASLFCVNNNIQISETLLDELMVWTDSIRKTYINNKNEGVYISSRRIGFILKAYKILGSLTSAIESVISKYTEAEQDALMMMWKSVHASSSDND